eukprot:10902196-Lingulodinium_polyedra.AAC.1
MEFGNMMTWHRYAGIDMAGVEVLRQVHIRWPNVVVSDLPWLPLSTVVENAEESAWPTRAATKGPVERHSASRADSWKKALVAKHPGLKSVLADRAEPKAGGSAGPPEEEFADDAATAPEEEIDEDLLFQEAVGIIEKNRREKHGIAPYQEREFRAALRASHDSWQGQTKRGNPAEAWCMHHGLQRTMKFPVVLGDDTARVMASAWAHKMQFLYDASREGLLDKADTKAAVLAAYDEQEPPEFRAIMEKATGLVLQH